MGSLLTPIKCQSNYVRPSPLFCAFVTQLMCSSCGANTRSICLSIICATTSKQLLGFKLSVPLLDVSVSSLRSTSPEADKLRQAVLIIIHEITMLTKEGLRCIDSFCEI
ncbi:hypothetical protein AVEN_94415-1 [Araneus ventricosus]|uniref:Uncharacterized protein n=1 Tax=Araneus ventricosus TaxID=182803 RepID=A0A4Y2J1T6_ARAVE|nr:hypothetical protein AVEN_94415-1 [Araneus ventricosus]